MNGRDDHDLFIGIGILVFFGSVLLLLFTDAVFFIYSALVGIVLFIVAGIIYVVQTPKRKEDAIIQRKQDEESATAYNSVIEEWTDTNYVALVRKYNIRKNTKTVTVKNEHEWDTSLFGIKNYIFISDGKLCLLPVYDEYEIWAGDWSTNYRRYGELVNHLNSFFAFVQIPLDKIEFYNIGGEFYRENKISGGGGGSDIGGAIIGGVIAGGAGAIIGSRQQAEEIKSELVTHDTRETVLSYFNISGNRQTMVFEHENYQVLEDLIPEKNYTIVTEVKRQGLVQKSAKIDETKAITEQIKELANLKDAGILTEEEFNDKKKELLAKM